MALSFLSRRDGLQVAEYLRRAGAMRIADDGLHLCADSCELSPVLHDLQARSERHTSLYWDRLVRRSGPAGPGHGCGAEPEPVTQQPVSYSQQGGELMELGKNHAAAVDRTAREAVDLFDRYVRERIQSEGGATEAAERRLLEMFNELLEASSTLVRHHFERTVLRAAREHIEKR